MTVSVIIPMYNAEKSILSTLESINMQTYPVFEIIIVNDGSKDDSVKIVEYYIESHQNMDWKLLHQDNKGVSAARNRGLKIAKGDWIALIDSDDEWLPNKIERQLEIITHNPGIDLLGTNRNGEVFSRFFFKKLTLLTFISSKDLLYKMFFITPTILFKRILLDEIGYFDENRRYLEDAHLFIRIATSKKCYLLNESLVITGGGKAHFGEKGLSGNLWKMEKGELDNIRFARENGIINNFEFFTAYSFSCFKFLRRVLITGLRFSRK